MKKILLLFTFMLGTMISISAQKEKLDDLFDRYQDSEGITSIKIAKPMFSMLNKLDIGDGELDQIKPLLAKINGLKMLIIEKPGGFLKNGKTSSSVNYTGVQNDISSILKTLKYEELMSVNSKDNKIKFLSAGAVNGILDDLILNISSDGNSILMMLDGKISMDNVSKLVSETQTFSSKSNYNENATVINRNSEERKLGKFVGLEVGSGIKVNFTQGPQQNIRVETDEDKLQYISTVVENNILKIMVKNTGKKSLNFNKIFVNIIAPELNQISTSAGSNLTVLNTLKAERINVDASSGSLINGDFDIKNKAELSVTSGANLNLNINTNQLSFDGTSGSNATINGKADQANFQLTSAANCNAQNLIINNATASVTSAANLTVNVFGTLDAKANSAGKIRYRGNPKNIISDISKSSGGQLTKFD